MTENSNSKEFTEIKEAILQSYWEQYKYFRIGEQLKYWQIPIINYLQFIFSRIYSGVDKCPLFIIGKKLGYEIVYKLYLYNIYMMNLIYMK